MSLNLKTIRTALVYPPRGVDWAFVACSALSWVTLSLASVITMCVGSLPPIALILFAIGVGVGLGGFFGVVATVFTRHPHHEDAIRLADALLDEEVRKGP